MAKFLNKKEQVFDLQLTTYGRYLLSIGKFKPYCYEFFDDNILYDGRYAMYTGSNAPEKSVLDLQLHENQNEIFHRIKNETQYLESLVLFSEVENEIGQIDTDIGEQESAAYSTDETPKENKPSSDIYRFNAGIGDLLSTAGNRQTAPAWKIVMLQGEISSSADSENHSKSIKIPQINIETKYTRISTNATPAFGPDDEDENRFDLRQSFGMETDFFSNNKVVKILANDPVIYAEEVNTLLLTENFDIEFFEVDATEATNAVAEMGFQAADSDLNGETFTINDGTNSVTFTWTTGTVDSNTKINASYDGAFAFWAMASRAKLAIENYISGGGSLNVSVSHELHKVIITNTNGAGISTNTMGGPSPGTARVTSSDEEKIITSGGFFTGGKDANEQLIRKYFKKEINQIVDGMMISDSPMATPEEKITTGSVEYYFDIQSDMQVPVEIACRGAQEFNNQSFYVDLDFNCSEFADENFNRPAAKYFDIYGHVTEPEICQD